MVHHTYKGCPHLTDADYLARLKSRLKVMPNGCWEIQTFRHVEGYGAMSYRGTLYRSHKLMYMLAVGPVPAGMCVMHKCDNAPCCNPDHLKLGTRAENNKDMHAKGRSNYSKARKTTCKHGHPFTPENTKVTKEGFRQCATCNRLRQRPGYVRPEKPPLTADQLRQQRYRIKRKQRLAQQNVQQ
jgi:hypothetical protein